MKKAFSLLGALALFTLFSTPLMAQVDDCCGNPSDDIKTLANSVRHFGFYGGLSFKSTEMNQETLMMAGIRLGFVANRSLGIGFEGYGIIPTSTYHNILPGQSLIALGGYGGLTIEPIFWSNKAVHLTFPVSAGGGWIGYHEDWREDIFGYTDLVADDVFWYVEPGVNAEINISKVLRLDLGVSKRFVQDFSLLGTAPAAFEGISYNFGLKIGRF